MNSLLGLLALLSFVQAQDLHTIMKMQETFRRLREPPEPRVQEALLDQLQSPLLSHPLSFLWGIKGIPPVLNVSELIDSLSLPLSPSSSSLVQELASKSPTKLTRGLKTDDNEASLTNPIAFALGLLTPLFNVSQPCEAQSNFYIRNLFGIGKNGLNYDDNGKNNDSREEEEAPPPAPPAIPWAFLMADATGKIPRHILSSVANYCELRAFYDAPDFCDAFAAEDARRHLVVPKGNTAAMGSFRGCINVNNALAMLEMRIEGAYCTVMVDGKENSGSVERNVFDADIVAFFLRQMRPMWGQCVPSACTAQDMSNHLNIMYEKLPAVFDVVGCETKASQENIGHIEENRAYSIGLALVCLGLLTLTGTASDALAADQRLESSSMSSIFRVLAIFSLRANGKRLLDSNFNEDPVLSVTTGLKVISLCWIMWMNLFAFLDHFPLIIDKFHLDKIFEGQSTPPYYELISNGYVAVDSFFFLSALALALPVFKHIKEQQYRKAIFVFVEKFIRVLVLNLAILLLALYILPHLGSGPIWSSFVSKEITAKCENQWWANVFLVNNLQFVTKDVNQICNPPSWWMAADMQLSLILAPLVIVLMSFFGPLVNIVGWTALQIGFTSLIAAIVAAFNLPASLVFRHNDDFVSSNETGLNNGTDTSTEMNVYTDFYVSPWSHAQPFMVGILTAYLLSKKRPRMNVWVALLLWAACLMAMFLVVFGLHPFHGRHRMADPNSIDEMVAVVYQGGAKLVWSLCLAWVVLASAYGRAGYVKNILSYGFFVSLARFNFEAYLVHYLVYVLYFASLKNTFEASLPWMIFFFNGIAVIAYIAAFLIGVLIEQPSSRIIDGMLGLLSTREEMDVGDNVDNDDIVIKSFNAVNNGNAVNEDEAISRLD